MSDGTSAQKFYGKYRGLVLNNIDPLQQGRLMVQVPDVAGLAPATWAMPCAPVGGIQHGMFAAPISRPPPAPPRHTRDLSSPPPNTGAWVVGGGAGGPPRIPRIWVGCFWGS